MWHVMSPSPLPTDSEYFRESIRHEIRMARERFSGQALSEELSHIQKRLDSVELLTPDIVMNLILSYRDIQVCMRIFTCAVCKCNLQGVCNRCQAANKQLNVIFLTWCNFSYFI